MTGSVLPTGRMPLLAGSLLAALGIALGAFGAHGLRNLLGPTELGWWQTAVQYQMWNAVGLLGLGAAGVSRSALPTGLLVTGTLVFAGTLYLMALSGLRWLGMITPIGGGLMIAGWLLVAWRVWRA
ncbi:DUF423 domain-containing protein [Azoarcus sp. KH32C]|uniref:DUF423 domain-containing protein n=1 Tax=Azoarcus sp. KH32C TaxID=748247 RepID=UPI0002386413|nr:DUF423 domain-containing protein [Azoarcus sp. KH32C]BAL25730.1 hypothetical protein AZKH_3441 [Azoarcus sp. KH32C]